ncbi:uncharacterized protein LOC123557132 [Mercenaria mercenaria]|uniref:uncharacterized protein LOC123557132 n=1 Tax=Mercenaria mercenaria TaxID=6596 RepID=UPI00234F7487|nr:uncharacterized protein LOC123557132 [Mercenaria mercenaria]
MTTQAMMRVIEKRGIVKVPQEIVPRDTFTTSSQMEELEDDLVASCLAKLQDGVKVTPVDATEALKQYRKFQLEMGRLQTLISRPSRYPKMTSSLYMQEKSFKDRTKKIIEAKEKEIVNLKQKVTEMSLRLSAILGTQVVEEDDKKSDLTDSVKPVKIAEDYRTIYHMEYQVAQEELAIAMEEAKVLVYLGKVTWVAYEFAKDIAKQQLAELMKKEIEILRVMSRPSYEEKERRKPLVADGISARKFERDETLQLLKDYRRCLARTAVPGVKQIFQTLMARSPPEKGGTLTDGVKKYIRKVVEQTYLMCIQEPPMHLEWVRFGDILDTEKYKPYKGEGNQIVGTIWPVVLRHKGGPVMSRGIVDVMFSQKNGPRSVVMQKQKYY